MNDIVHNIIRDTCDAYYYHEYGKNKSSAMYHLMYSTVQYVGRSLINRTQLMVLWTALCRTKMYKDFL